MPITVDYKAMIRSLGSPIQLSAGYGRVEATWINDTAIWISDYCTNNDPELEAYGLNRRIKDLSQRFRQAKLFEPIVEVLDTAESELDTDSESAIGNLGGQLLRVTTLLVPLIDPNYIRPIMELRVPPPQREEVEQCLVERDLRAGGNAVFNSFASAMTKRI